MLAQLDDSDALPPDEVGARCAARVGEVVADTYRITRHIASGGSSHVFEVEHLRLGRAFALKLMRAEILGKTAVQRFRREAKAIARVSHEHVVYVVDCGEIEDGTPYLVMELLSGEDLRSLLAREGRLSLRRAVGIVTEASRGVAAMHAAGLVHRDLKPENLFITRRAGGEDWCKVLDFGVAKMDSSLSTAQGAIVGTVRYMAPEQLTGGAIGPATDVYALAAVLYECLSGRPPHEGKTVQESMYRVMNREPEPLESACPHLPQAVIELVTSGLSKLPRSRPASVREFEAALAKATAGKNAAPPATTVADEADAPARSPAGPRVSWPLWAVLTAGMLAAVVWGARALERSDHDETASVRPAPEARAVRPPAAAEQPRHEAVVFEPAPPARPPSALATAPAPAAPARTSRASPRADRPRSIESGSGAQAASSSQADPPRVPVSLGRMDETNPYGD